MSCDEHRRGGLNILCGGAREPGGEVVRDLLADLDPVALADELRTEMKDTSSAAQIRRFAKRLKIVEGFRDSGNQPEHM
ncbi:MAG: hypothetical protein QF464_16900, partial [Myxococcota bacterium]|nr:hypothetical protein [Myxococcota bacterium]